MNIRIKRSLLCLVMAVLVLCGCVDKKVYTYRDTNFRKYVTTVMSDDPGKVPLIFDIREVIVNKNQITVKGTALDKRTKEGLRYTNLVIAKEFNRENQNGWYLQPELNVYHELGSSNPNGYFEVTFSKNEIEVLGGTLTGFHSAVFMVEDFLKDHS